jgi:hypothetical protein
VEVWASMFGVSHDLVTKTVQSIRTATGTANTDAELLSFLTVGFQQVDCSPERLLGFVARVVAIPRCGKDMGGVTAALQLLAAYRGERATRVEALAGAFEILDAQLFARDGGSTNLQRSLARLNVNTDSSVGAVFDMMAKIVSNPRSLDRIDLDDRVRGVVEDLGVTENFARISAAGRPLSQAAGSEAGSRFAALLQQFASDPAKAVVPTSPGLLCDDFGSNALAAERRYQGNRLDVAGTIKLFNRSMTGEPWVALAGVPSDVDFDCNVNLEFPVEREQEVLDAKVGEPFHAVCRFDGGPTGFLMGDVMLTDCSRVR